MRPGRRRARNQQLGEFGSPDVQHRGKRFETIVKYPLAEADCIVSLSLYPPSTRRTPDEFMDTNRPHSSSFLGLIFRILQGIPKKELLWGLWVTLNRKPQQ